MLPAIVGREGGAIDVRGPLVGGSIVFCPLPAGVFVLEGVPGDAVKPSCFVGDLLGDCGLSVMLSTFAFESCPLQKIAYRQPRRPRRPSTRGWTSSINTFPLPSLWIENALPLQRPRSTHTRRSSFRSNTIRPPVRCPCRLRCSLIFLGLDAGRLEEHAIIRQAIEVSLALYSSIILARAVFELNTDPVTGCEMEVSKVAYYGVAAI
jgi:hypothetical protein